MRRRELDEIKKHYENKAAVQQRFTKTANRFRAVYQCTVYQEEAIEFHFAKANDIPKLWLVRVSNQDLIPIHITRLDFHSVFVPENARTANALVGQVHVNKGCILSHDPIAMSLVWRKIPGGRHTRESRSWGNRAQIALDASL